MSGVVITAARQCPRRSDVVCMSQKEVRLCDIQCMGLVLLLKEI